MKLKNGSYLENGMIWKEGKEERKTKITGVSGLSYFYNYLADSMIGKIETSEIEEANKELPDGMNFEAPKNAEIKTAKKIWQFEKQINSSHHYGYDEEDEMINIAWDMQNK